MSTVGSRSQGRPAVVGTGMLGACVALAHPGTVSPAETKVFERINAGVGPAERPVWLAMQFGNGLTAVAVPALLMLGGRSKVEALRVALAGFGAWQLAKAIKRVVPRARPAVLLDEVVLRDGDPDGGGFVSGHAAVSMATAVTAGAVLGVVPRRFLFGAAGVVGLARVHVGAHLPLDVVGGAGLGLLWGALCASFPLRSVVPTAGRTAAAITGGLS